MPIVFSVEELTNSLIEEIAPLLINHWHETAHHKDEIPLDPDYLTYLKMQEHGCLLVTTARDNEKIVGYFTNIFTPHLHHKNHIMSSADIFYIDPDYRNKNVFAGLFKFTLEELKSRSVSVVNMHTRNTHDFSRFLENMGFTFIEKHFELKL